MKTKVFSALVSAIAAISLGALAAVIACVPPQPQTGGVNQPTGSGGTAATGQKPAGVEVKLCDNHTKVDVATMPTTRSEGQKVADALMSQWKLANKDRAWEENQRRSHPRIPQPADNSNVIAKNQQGAGQTYGTYTKRDVLTWKRETERLVLEGAAVFHDAKALGSTIAVSCDMCHPDASNTHPETYPKYQVQMGRVALLRDMINWCLEHPVRAKPMAADDPRMRAMEAYIAAQRKGTAFNYGKH